MGNRVKGRVKKKSVKASSHSGIGSKRKLSRMGKKQKKNHSGLNATFLGRTACLKKLQISLKDFRRLCILKGVYPRKLLGRVPAQKRDQTFYHMADIKAIAHEPVLERFRDFKAFTKKIRRAAGRLEHDEATRKNALVPTYNLHHIVKERYPRFSDALSDIDDALTLVYLFAALPGEAPLKSSVTARAKLLTAAWGAYCAATFAITRSFISVKGVYLEAHIHGTYVRWVVPHSFTQFMPEEVDYSVMQTFFEVFQTLLNFVLFKLYNEIGVRYPLRLDDAREMLGSGNPIALLAANVQALKSALSSATGAVGTSVTSAVDKSTDGKDSQAAVAGANSTSTGETKTEKAQKNLIQQVNVALRKAKGKFDDQNHAEVGGSDPENVSALLLKMAHETTAAEEDFMAISMGGNDIGLHDEGRKRKHLFAGLTFFLSREVPRGYLELVCLAYGGRIGWDDDDSPISIEDPIITHHVTDRDNAFTRHNGPLPTSREFIQPQWIIDCANFMLILPASGYAVGVILPPHLSPWGDDDGHQAAYAEQIARIRDGEAPDINGERPYDEREHIISSEPARGIDGGNHGKTSQEVSEDNDLNKEDAEEERKHVKEDEARRLAKVMMGRKASRLYSRMQRGIARRAASIETLQKRSREPGKSVKG